MKSELKQPIFETQVKHRDDQLPRPQVFRPTRNVDDHVELICHQRLKKTKRRLKQWDDGAKRSHHQKRILLSERCRRDVWAERKLTDHLHILTNNCDLTEADSYNHFYEDEGGPPYGT